MPLIIDTDASFDVDDVLAICMAHALERRGEAQILAVMHDAGIPEGTFRTFIINAIHYFQGWGRYLEKVSKDTDTLLTDIHKQDLKYGNIAVSH